MSQRTPSPIITPGERSLSGRNTTWLRNGLVIGAALCALALISILVRLHSSHHPLPPPVSAPPPQTPQNGGNAAPLSTVIGTSPTPNAQGSTPTSRENLAQMIAQYRQRLQHDPGDLQSRIRLGALLDIQGDPSDAEDVLRVGLQRGQRTPELYHALGLVYLNSKIYLPAAEAFYLETRLKPGDFQAHLQSGTAYAYLGKAAQAQQQFQMAHKIKPAAPEPYWGFAFLNDSSERYPYAVRYLQEYLRRGGQPGPGYGLLCRVYLDMHLYDKSIEAGKTASLAQPNDSKIWYNLGRAYASRLDARSLPDAAQALARSVQLAPNWESPHFELGNVYSRLNRHEDAIAQYREAIRCEPSQGKYYYELGQLLVRQGQQAEGQQMLGKARTLLPLNQREHQLLDQLAFTPDVSRLKFELALVYKQLGKYELAQDWLLSIIHSDPKYPQARTELDAMHSLAAAASPRS